MVCQRVDIGGITAIVCGPRPRAKRCRAEGCQRAGQLLCDWKTGPGKTCDMPICSGHAQDVAPDKHLCPTHQADYRAWLNEKGFGT